MASWAAGVMYGECFNALQRHGDAVEIATLADFMGNRWNSNAVMLPAPSWVPGAKPYLLPVGHIAKLYRHHIGKQAVAVQNGTSSLDVAASRTGNKFFCHLVNKERSTPQKIELSERQIEILSYVAKGFNNTEIASMVGISRDCVKAHLSAAFTRLNASSRSEAVAIAIRIGLLP